MPDPRMTSRMASFFRALIRAVVAVAVCMMAGAACQVVAADDDTVEVESPASQRRETEKQPSRWQQLDVALTDLGPDSERARQLVPELISAARHPETPVILRQRAILMLGRIGEPAEDAIPVFLKLLAEYRQAESLNDDPSTVTPVEAVERRVWLLESLGDFGEAAKDAVPGLRRDLVDRSRSIDDRVLVADVLGQIGTVPAVSALADALRQWPPGTPPDEQLVKRTIVDCIGLSGPVGVVGLPALLRAIEDPDSSTRRKVCEAITLFGPAGELATDALVERLILDEVPAVQDAAADTLAAVGPASIPVLIRLLESGEPDLQWRAARSLGKIGPAARQARTSLESVITAGTKTTDAEPLTQQARIEAFAAHWQITRDTSGVFGRVVDELVSEDRQIRRRASELLIAPKVLPDDLRHRLNELAAGESNAARAAAYVLRRRDASDGR